MPIADCIAAADCRQGSGDLIELWAHESGQSSDQMTINIITGTRQFGNEYPVMARLWLPSVWPRADVSSLQSGLAIALAKYFDLAPREVHVITQRVNSGMVVEDGQEIRW